MPISCEQCGKAVRRIPEVGDAWLDAGIVPFSTLGWQNEQARPGGYADGAVGGPLGRRPARPLLLGDVVPGRLGLGVARADPALVLLAVVHVGRADRAGAVPARAGVREAARRVRARDAQVVGQRDRRGRGDRADGRRRHALPVRRPHAEPEPELRLRAGERDQAPPAHLLELGAVLRHLRGDRGLRPTWADAESGPSCELRPLDRWLLARTQHLVGEATDAYERFWTPDITDAWERFVDDLSNWYIRRSRRRFYSLDEAAFRTLWTALVQATRVISPVMPFLAEQLWQRLVRDVAEGAPDSVFLAGWPEPVDALADEPLVASMSEVRRVAALGHQARAASRLKLRQPLRRLVVEGAPLAEAHADELGDELRAKEVEFGRVEATELHVKPHLPVLGPKLGKELGAVRAALAAGRVRGAAGRRLPRGRSRPRPPTRCSSSARDGRAGRSPPTRA